MSEKTALLSTRRKRRTATVLSLLFRFWIIEVKNWASVSYPGSGQESLLQFSFAKRENALVLQKVVAHWQFGKRQF